jgi:uncharacterized YccA/Bax inhibitor family protein
MQSSNPVFTRSEGFNGKPVTNAYGDTTYPASGMTYPEYGATSQRGGHDDPPTHTRTGTGPMTIDSVVQKTAVTLGVIVLVAGATWLMTGDPAGTGPDAESAARTLYTLSLLGAFGGFALSMVNSFKRVVSPALVLAYAALQGLFIGAMSKTFEAIWGQGIVIGAVLGTVAAVGGTLAAYKFFDIQVGNKFRTWVIGAMFGFVALSLLDLVLGFFHASFGFNGFGGIGLIASVAGLGLGVLMLILDFDFIERGIAAGLPEQESWRAAFGLSVTIVWIYIELLRILAILRNN